MPRYSSDKQKEVSRLIQTTHGLTGTKEYNAWLAMKQRCYDINSKSYKNYGGRGISVCKKWINNFMAFLNDMGYAPTSKHTVDRKNVNGNYTSNNVRWATRLEQVHNRRKTQ